MKKTTITLLAVMLGLALTACSTDAPETTAAPTEAATAAETEGVADTGEKSEDDDGQAAEQADAESEGSETADGNEAAAEASVAGRNISVMTPYLGSVTTNQMVGYLEEKLDAQGANVDVINTDNDFAELASRIEDVVAAGTDAIILVSADPNQVENQLREAFEAEIPVFGVDSGYIDGMQVNATSDNYQMGELIVRYLFDDLMGGEGTVIALTHRPHPGVVKRCEAFDAIIEEYPDITLITEQHVPAEQPINDAQAIVEDLLLANPDEGSITAIWAGWDEPAIGATKALQEAGRDEVIVTGVDGNDQAVELVKEGTNLKATVKQNFEGMTDIICEQLAKYFDGETLEVGEMYAPAELVLPE